MTLDAELSQSQEERLQEVIAAYLRDAEAGRNPVQAELLNRHPDLAGELQSFFAGQEHIGRLAAPLRQVVEPTLGNGISGTLGDFRIVREVGRGGMGIVYEAEQISLRRRVALKVLPFAATMDARHLQRFHNEAQAAACLHHTNIVPVFSVGCERGVHFYAMQFIDGQPLSEIIRQIRRLEKKEPLPSENGTAAYRPSPGEAASTPLAAEMTPLTGEGRRSRDYYHKVAELGIQAAEALDHAHQLGIVHRDIKPGNLMLDGTGRLWVTDFGLAHMQHGEASLTLTGQALGTPRYMSPEQALAKRVPIDHRTDVYSLGVTLYELLTLRPAFTSDDRHELARQIAYEEPVKPRRLDRAIPAEVETIVLKAMEKRPQDRYATAQELADDLERWLKHEPIRARRPSPIQVAAKWMRRHQSAVWAASLLLFVLMIGVVINALWWSQQQVAAAKRQMEEAEKQTTAETEARAAFDEAVRWQQEERWPEALSAIRRAQGVLRGFESDANLRQHIDERGKDVDMAQRLEEARLQYTAAKGEEFNFEGCIAAYVDAFAWYGLDVEHGDANAAAEYIRSRSIPMQLVAALDHWARVERRWKDQEWKHLLAVASAADSDAWRNRFRDAWERENGKTINELLASVEVEKLLPAMLSWLVAPAYRHEGVSGERIVSLLRRVQQRRPADFWINLDLGQLFRVTKPPQLDESIRHCMIAVALRPQSPGARNSLGLALYDKGHLDEAIAEYREAIRLHRGYFPAHNNLGIALRNKGYLDEAIAEWRETVRLKKDSAPAHSNLGSALRDKGYLDEAIAECREAVRLKKDSALAHSNLGLALGEKGLLDEAMAEFHKVIRLDKDWADAHGGLGEALRRKGHFDEAIAEFREAIRLKKDFSEAHNGLGVALYGKGHLDEAIAEFREAIRLKKDYAEPQKNLNEALAERDVLAKLPAIQSGKAKVDNPAECLGLASVCQKPYKRLNAAAVQFYSDAFAAQPHLADDLDAHHRYNAALAGCGQGTDVDKLDPKELARLRRQALDWLRADLKAYRQVLEKSVAKAGPLIAQLMQHWLQDSDFAGVRGDKELAKLPEAERKDWQKLWQEVEELRQRAAQPPKTASPARP